VCRTLSLAKLRGKTALVLQAHDGIGALVTQELTSLGVTVIAQVVPDQLEDEITAEERARLFGAAKVIVEEPLVALTGREESSCDFVIDTVGGRRIWEAARWALRDGGQVCLLTYFYTPLLTTNTYSLRLLSATLLRQSHP
jgi:NADPH:quinone reductase-like Zn-dependent oxidoreductase